MATSKLTKSKIQELLNYSDEPVTLKEQTEIESIIDLDMQEYLDENPEAFKKSDRKRFIDIAISFQNENNGINQDHIEYIIHNF